MMHSTGDYGSSGVPAFLHKLWALVEDEGTNDLIAWDLSGKSFHVFEQSRFSKEVLPHYFKHSNIASFVRQLNMYGFRKITSVEHGGLKIERDDMEFSHPYFQRGSEELLENIKRKVANSKADDVRLKTDDVSKVLRDVHSMKGRQETITSKMDTLERENEALWREVANLRQKHHKQQKIVNKLIQFLVTLVGNRGLGGGVKRKMPLMINDVSQLDTGPSAPKLARQYSLDNNSANNSNIQVIPTVESPSSVAFPAQPSGLKIEEMESVGNQQVPPQYRVINMGASTGTSQPQTYVLVNPGTQATTQSVVTNPPPSMIVTSQTPQTTSNLTLKQEDLSSFAPQELSLDNFISADNIIVTGAESESDADPVITAASPQRKKKTSTAVAIPESSKGPTTGVLADMSSQISSLDTSLDDLREMLAGNAEFTSSSLAGLRLDADTLQGLFTPEAPIPQTPEPLFNILDDGKPDFNIASAQNITGNEMIQYNPPDDFGSLFDLGLDSPTGSDDDILSPENLSSGLDTPSFDLTSPLARRRQSKNTTVTTEEVD